MGQLLSAAITAYCEANSSPVPDYLKALERDTFLKQLNPTMMSDPMQGRFLAFLSHLTRPQRILEVGSFTGYSALCLAEGLTSGGRITAVEIDEEKESTIRHFFERAGMTDRLDLHIGNGLQIVPELDPGFDIVFIDANKRDNALLYDLVFSKLAPGGLLLVDNTLWFGKVLEEGVDTDTDLIRSFNLKLTQDDRTQNLLLPIRDGITLVRKLSD
ncbi:MAG: class I SAM-dependent methyltransferase [Bacteroidota bacterium]